MADTAENKEYNLYRDIRNRTNGEVYLGVVGPVRTGKSTFIRRFMELLVLPFMEDEQEKKRALDELPPGGCRKNSDDDGTEVYSEAGRVHTSAGRERRARRHRW